MAERQIDDDAFERAALDAFEYLGHDVVLGAVEEQRPDGADEGEEVFWAFWSSSSSKRRWKATRAAGERPW